MVKRILHLVLALAILLSLSACAAGNNGGNNRLGKNNNSPDMRRLTQENTNNLTYRDGVYTGYGDPHNNGNEVATVVIRNGRIADIDLTIVGQQGGSNNGANTGRTNQIGTGTITPGTTGSGTTRLGDVPMPGGTTNNTTDTDMGTRTGTGTGITDDTAMDAFDGVRTGLENAMIRDQRYDVTIENNDIALVMTMNNWKLAVRRALEQASNIS